MRGWGRNVYGVQIRTNSAQGYSFRRSKSSHRHASDARFAVANNLILIRTRRSPKRLSKRSRTGEDLGAERPYIIRDGSKYVVIEGNNRIAAYKLLTGQLHPPRDYTGSIPQISDKTKDTLSEVDCSVAPSREALLPIMVSAHFGLGDKSKWGYLGSRKAIYDEWESGVSISQLSKAFKISQGDVKEYILEYLLYLKAIGLNWSHAEKQVLLNPKVAFNPPVRVSTNERSQRKNGNYARSSENEGRLPRA